MIDKKEERNTMIDTKQLNRIFTTNPAIILSFKNIIFTNGKYNDDGIICN
jgi:hypothetical protein